MKAYRLWSDKTIDICENTWLVDIDEDYFSKKEYIENAKYYTDKANKEFGTKYTWQELFGEPEDIGWRYCKKHDCFYWEDDGCPECEDW